MATTFSSLPIVDLAPLKAPLGPTTGQLTALSKHLYDVFSTTGFAYLINVPLSFDHVDVFGLALEFFALPEEEKMKLAKKTFRKENKNTYRGYFPVQPLDATDNLKEGFEIGPPKVTAAAESEYAKSSKFNLSEPNVWPAEVVFPSRTRLEHLYAELQSLSERLLSMLASSLGKPADFFADYLTDSLSTLRLLHYPPVAVSTESDPGVNPRASAATPPPDAEEEPVKLSCTPHTDSGILTLLHQDASGGLEVQASSGQWVPAPYVPGSIVINIGDLMAKVSGGRFVATMHRVRAPRPVSMASVDGEEVTATRFGRFSVPFFFEPGENCVVRSVDNENEGVVYGEYVRGKMKTWVEYKDDEEGEEAAE